MKPSTFSMPMRSTWRRMRVAWFAILSIILRLVFEKEKLFLKKSMCPQHVGHDHLLVDQRVALEQVGVRGVVVDDHLVDLREAIDVALGQLLEVHAEAPVRIADREAAERGDLLHALVVEDLEGRVRRNPGQSRGRSLRLRFGSRAVGGQVGHWLLSSLAEEGPDRLHDPVLLLLISETSTLSVSSKCSFTSLRNWPDP